MPNLISQTDAGWQQAENTIEAWYGIDEWQPGQALRLSIDDEPADHFAQASAIAIDFPAFTDGRGLSLAVLIRSRLNYAGELRAVGNVHEDILHYMVRCGFNAIELADDKDVELALSVISPYSDLYQGSVTTPEPSFRRVQRGG